MTSAKACPIITNNIFITNIVTYSCILFCFYFLELIYCGCVLEDEMTLESYGLKSGAMIHVLRKRDPELPSLPTHISEDNILQLVSRFKSFKEHSGLRNALTVCKYNIKN